MHIGVKVDPSMCDAASDRISSALVRGLGPFASGMAARKGQDPLAGLERSQQPGPQGDAQFPAQGFQKP